MKTRQGRRLADKPSGSMPLLAPILLLSLSAIGVAVSGLSTRDHLLFRSSGGDRPGACGALIDSGCRSAHSSEVSEIYGVPISHFGSAFYLATAGLAIVAIVLRKRLVTPRESTAGVAPLVALMGLGAVAYSVFLATVLVRSGEPCPFCIILYGVNLAVLVVGTTWWWRGQRRVRPRAFFAPGAVVALVGGTSFAATTPFLLDEPSDTTPSGAEATASGRERRSSPLILPERVPTKGDPNAEDELVEFSDLECPHCGVLNQTVVSLFEERGPAGLRVRFVNYPLDPECNPHVPRSVHPTACLSARGGICAQEQNRFWSYAGSVFSLRGDRSREVLVETARELGLEPERFERCLDAVSTAETLAEDIELAHAAGVRATPTILVNAWPFEGALSRPRLQQLLDDTTPCGCDQRLSDGSCAGDGGK